MNEFQIFFNFGINGTVFITDWVDMLRENASNYYNSVFLCVIFCTNSEKAFWVV